MKIALHSSYLGYRGTEIALMDYAWGLREISGHQPFFLLPSREGGETHPVAGHMRNLGPLRFYRSAEERERILREERTDFLYAIKNGFADGVVSRQVPTGIHAIFRESEFHGDVYAYVSPWLSRMMSHGRTPWVPHMVRLAVADRDLRQELGIPADAVVFGRHGGDDSFDIPWVQAAVVDMALKRPDLWFLFLNTRRFSGAEGLAQVLFLPPVTDPAHKRAFLDACDAMIHGRQRGETFGLACAEFAEAGKPVFTFADSPERAHLELLGEAARPYGTRKELVGLLTGFRRGERITPRGTASIWSPEKVMQKFVEVFLDPKAPGLAPS